MDFFFFFQAEDGIRDGHVTGVKTCALPISPARCGAARRAGPRPAGEWWRRPPGPRWADRSGLWSSRRSLGMGSRRSEEHTSELQSRGHLVCRLLLEKKTGNMSRGLPPYGRACGCCTCLDIERTDRLRMPCE